MKIEELIEKYEYLNHDCFRRVDTSEVLRDLKQLDEPETGHADEAPRYVKNILARLRELPLHDREVWLKVIISEFKQDFSHAKWREGYEQGKVEGMVERDKVTIPQLIADWIEECKAKGKSLLGALLYTPEGVNSWVGNSENQELFALAWIFGYTIEKEKRYFVKIKATKHCFSKGGNGRIYFSLAYKSPFTKKELEKAGFGWVFNCTGLEVEEVTE